MCSDLTLVQKVRQPRRAPQMLPPRVARRPMRRSARFHATLDAMVRQQWASWAWALALYTAPIAASHPRTCAAHISPPFLCAPAVLGALMVFATRWWAELGAAGAAAAVTGWHTGVSWCAPPLRHLFLCAAALYVLRASAARGWRGSRGTVLALLCGAVFLECCFLGRETLGRETAVAHPITRHL
jgi:hypothetical protein